MSGRRIVTFIAAASWCAALLSFLLGLHWDDASVSATFKSGMPLSPHAHPLVAVTRGLLLGLSVAFLVLGFVVLVREESVRRFLARYARGLANLLTFLVTLVVVLTGLEVAVRMISGGQTSELGGAAYRAQLARIHLNSFGLRDREFSLDKPAGTVRIVAQGDSFTFGHGIENEAAPWPKALESLLNQHASDGTRYEVINAGQNGFGTADELASLKEMLPFRPDVVILGYFFNDAETDEMISHPRVLTTYERITYGVHLFLFNRSHLYGFAVVRWNALKLALGIEQGEPQRWNDLYRQPDKLAKHRQQLLQMRDLAAAAHAAFVILTIPGNYDFAHYPVPAGHAFMTAFCQEEHLSCIDPLPTFMKQDYTRTRLNPYDAHPSEYGHRLIAETIYDSPVFRSALPRDAFE